MTLLRLLRSLIYRDSPRVSDRWLRQYAQSQTKVEFHGVSWRFPIRKADLECGWRNRRAERRRAA